MNRDSSVDRDLSISDVDLFEDSVEWDSSKGEVSEQGLSEDEVSERGLSEHEVSERRSYKNSLEEHFSDKAIYSHSDNCHELATDSELTSTVPNQVEAVRKDPLPSQATGTIQYESFEGIGTQMTPEELSFFEKYQKAKDACPSSLKCSTCLCKLFLDNPQNIQIHPVLGVLLCKNCREFYGNTPFTKDIKGHDEYCRWCAEARAIIRCHTCSNVFCKGCLKRCLGHVPFAEVTGSKCAWNCLICNDLPLWAPRALARTVMSAINRRSCPEDSNDPAVWLPDMIDEVEKLSKYCNVLARKMRTTWSTDNENSKRKSQQSAPPGKETDKTAVIGCCLQLRKAVSTTHFNMKSLEKKMLTKFKKTYGTTADIDLHPEKSSPKRKPTGRESMAAIVKMCNVTEKYSEQDCSAQIEGFSPSFASHTLDALSSKYSPNGAISHYESSSRTKKRADVNVKAAEKESTPIRIKATPNSVERTSDSILPAKSNSKTMSFELESKYLDSDEPPTQDLNQKARRGLLKDSSDSDSLLSSDLDINLSQLEITSRVKAKSRNYPASMDDPKLKFECAVVINRITDANFTMAQGKPKMVGLGEDMDFQIKNLLNMKRRMRLESESETDPNSEKEENQRKTRSSIQGKNSIKRRSKIAEMWSSSSSSSDEVETNAEMTAVPTFSTVPLIPDREDSVRQALLAPSDSDTDILTSNIENEEPNHAPIASMQQNHSDDVDVAITTKEKSAKTIDVVDLTSDDEGPARFTNEADKLLRMSLHDPDTQTKRFQKDTDMKMNVMKRGKKKRSHHSSSDSESSESEVERRKLKKIRLSPSVVDGTSDDGDDDESDSESTSESELHPQTKIVDPTNSENSSNSENLNVSQCSETGGSKGRKAIRKIMADTSLTDETKAAAKEEENRKRRIAERQKCYNEAFVCAIADAQTNSLVLDFDPVTKKELVTVDKSIVTKLKLHQVQGVKFMWDACFESVERIKEHPGSGCILAHCMGLGKSLQVVTLVHTVITNKACQVDRVLVVCPVNIILNWVNEFKIWLGAKSGFDVYEITYSKHNKGASRVLTLDRWFKGGGVLIIGYAMYQHLVNDNSKVVKSQEERDLYARSLVHPGPQLVVCDEGHFLKNEKTATYETINKIATRRRIVMTGTPLQNNLEEYFCMVQFVKPNLLGTINEFKNRFANPIKNGQAADSNDRDVRIMKRRAHVLHKMLEDSVQRFDYSVLTPFLPPKHEYVISVKLSELQIKMYQHYLEKHVKGAKNPNRVKAAGLFADFHELGRVWTHPKALLLAAINSNKLKMKSNTDLKATTMDVTEDHAEPSLCEESDGLTFSDISSEKESGTALLNQSTALDESSVATPLPWWSPFCTEDMTKMELGGKLVLLMDILHQCELIGDKVLVFSQSLVSLSLIEEFLAIENERYKKERMSRASNDEPADKWRINHDYFRLDGQTSSELRTSACNVFNNPSKLRARLFLISTKAGGIGINLIAANRVIIFDASWNPSHDVQSIFRVYRFGQRKPCYIYRFLAQGTMEEKIYDRQVTKLSLSCRVVDEQQIERHFNSADLKYLYLFEPDSHLRRPTPILPKDRLLAELIIQRKDWIVTYHEHDSLLENKSEEELTEVERKAAWDDFENEKRGVNVTLKDPAEFANMPGIADITEALVGRTVAGVPLTSIASLIYDSNPDITREDFHERLRVTVEQMESFSTQQAVVASAFAAAAQRSRDSRSSLINQRLLVTNQNGSPRGNSPQQTESPGQSDIVTQVARNPGSGLTTRVHQLTNPSGSVATLQNSNTGGDELSGPNDVNPVHEELK